MAPRSAYKEVRGLSRGLEVLVAMNNYSRSRVTISTICRQTKLHRTTVKRLLETLRREHYVEYDEDSQTYSLRFLVKRLSEGYVDDEWLAEIARPILRSIGARTVWPINLVMFDLDAMLIRETTHYRRPILNENTMLGQRIPILFTAAGRAFLFACEEEKRCQILQILALKDDEEGVLARDTDRLKRLQAETEQQGCGFNVRAWSEHLDRIAIAVPVTREADVVGSINMIFHVKALSLSTAVEQNLPLLKEAAEAIRMGFRVQSRSDSQGECCSADPRIPGSDN